MKLKKILSVLFIIAMIFTTGCTEEVYRDNRMEDENLKKKELEYNVYTDALKDCGYNWYSKFLGDILTASKERENKVGESEINSQIEKVNVKLEEIEEINKKSVVEVLELRTKSISKKEKDEKKYIENLKENEGNIEGNKGVMKEILNSIKSGLELAKDGSFSPDDIKKIEGIQVDIIKKYNENIKILSY